MQAETDFPSYESCVVRGRALLTRSRYQESAECFRQGIAIEPRASLCYALLAIALMNIEGRAREAVDVARRAVAEEPEESFNHSILSMALGSLAKDGETDLCREALATAQEAVRLDPDSDLAYTSLGRAQLRLRQWVQAEASARKALELDPDDSSAAEILSVALLQQGKDGDHHHLVQHQLANSPESDTAHSAAGWNALRRGDHRRANEHFAEALRLNPTSEAARLGLIESYRARSFFYRWLIQLDAAVGRLTSGRQTAFWLGGYVVYKVAYGALRTTAPWAATLLMAAWLLLVFGSHLFRGLSSLFVLFDRFGRQSLRTKEKWEGIVVGGLAILAIVAMVASFGIASKTAMVEAKLLAFGLFAAALPAASAFTNDHYIGRWFYWAAAGFCGLCSLYAFTGYALGWAGVLPGFPADDLALMAGIGVAGVFTFVRAFGIGYR